MKKLILAGLAAMAAGLAGGVVANAADAGAANAAAKADKNRLEADVRYLADDLFEGREAGTRGHALAAKFAAERMRALGLTPAGGNGTYFQNVRLRSVKTATTEGGSLTLSGANAPASFERGVDYLVGSSVLAEHVDIEAPVVFVGYGFVSEEYGRDDYEGLDVEGKIVAAFSGAPKFLPSEERAHYRSTRNKRASDRGAIGVITLWDPQLEDRFAFERLSKFFGRRTGMTWVSEEGVAYTGSPNIQAAASVSMPGAQKLFANAPYTWEEAIAAAATDEGVVKGFDMGVTAHIVTDSVHGELTSPNVIGLLPGSDAKLKNEYIVMSAHLDHTGMRPTPEEGDDEINNGAMDNATGSAAVLEVARLLAKNPPRRSILFTLVTAEEKGLVGSSYNAVNPSVPKEKIVANINMDMPILTYPFSDVVAFGAEHSTLYPVVEKAATAAGLTLSPDPAPEQGYFVRSDQYSYVKEGIPAVYLDLGFGNGGEEAQDIFIREHYHKPSDEADGVDYEQLRRFTQVNYELSKGIANMNKRPRWKKDDFFGKTFGGPMEK